MLKNIALSAIVALSLAVVGCGKTDQEKAEAAADRGRANIKKMTVLIEKLGKEGIYLYTPKPEVAALASKMTLDKKTTEERKALLPMLNQYLALALDTLEMDKKKGVELKNKQVILTTVKITKAVIAEIENPTAEIPASPATPEQKADFI